MFAVMGITGNVGGAIVPRMGPRPPLTRSRKCCCCAEPGEEGSDFFSVAKIANGVSINGIGFFQITHGLGEPAHRARVHNRHRKPLGREQRKGYLLVAAAGFHGDQMNLVFSTGSEAVF